MADTTNRIAGVAYVTVDGVNYPLQGELAYDPALVTRKTETGQDRVHGYSESPFAPYIEGYFRDMGGLSVAAFNAMTNNTIILELANGKVIVGRNMWTVETQEVDTAEAKFKVRWEGFSGSVSET